jgi:hypothetical protein
MSQLLDTSRMTAIYTKIVKYNDVEKLQRDLGRTGEWAGGQW